MTDQNDDQADRESLLVQIADHVHDLTRPHDHIEDYTADIAPGVSATRRHRTRVPALLTQLGADTRDTSIDAGQRGVYASKPPSRLDALDTLARIDLAAHRWIRDLTDDQTYAVGETADLVRRVGALAASADPEQQAAIARAVRGWRTWARVVTGWDQPAWAPDATCPACERLGTLRIRFLERRGMCTDPACEAWWDTGTIGLLADHVRLEVAAREGRDRGRQACNVLGDYEPEDLEHLCRACGSARCVRAVGARLAALAAVPVDLDELDPEARAAEVERRERARSLRSWKAWSA